MSEFVNTIDLLGDEAVAKSLIDRTITEFHDDVVTNVGKNAFRECSAMTGVKLLNVVDVEENAFFDCKALKQVDIPKMQTAGQQIFNGCSALTRLVLPNLTTGAFYMCAYCYSLKEIDLRKLTSFGSGMFWNVKTIDTLVIGAESVCPYTDNPLSGSQFSSSGTGGTLIVARSLITEYQNETNWSAILAQNANNRILALEDYTVDGTTTGEIDWDKLGGTT